MQYYILKTVLVSPEKKHRLSAPKSSIILRFSTQILIAVFHCDLYQKYTVQEHRQKQWSVKHHFVTQSTVFVTTKIILKHLKFIFWQMISKVFKLKERDPQNREMERVCCESVMCIYFSYDDFELRYHIT